MKDFLFSKTEFNNSDKWTDIYAVLSAEGGAQLKNIFTLCCTCSGLKSCQQLSSSSYKARNKLNYVDICFSRFIYL